MSKVDELIARAHELAAEASAVATDGSRVSMVMFMGPSYVRAMAEEYRTLAPKLAYMLERAMAALKRIEQGEFGDWGGDVALVARAEIEAIAEGSEA